MLKDSYTWTHQCWSTSKKLKFISSVRTLNAIKKTCLERWPIGTDSVGESREFVRSASLNDDEDDDEDDDDDDDSFFSFFFAGGEGGIKKCILIISLFYTIYNFLLFWDLGWFSFDFFLFLFNFSFFLHLNPLMLIVF